MDAIAIELTRGKVAFVDPEDFPLVAEFKWFAHESKLKDHPSVFYAARNVKISPTETRLVFMHRVILDAPKGVKVDHADGDGLNNRRSNIRLATDSQNSVNRRRALPGTLSAFRGVTFNRSCGKWQASIKSSGKNRYLGVFADEKEAARAYDAAAIECFGEFAVLNFCDAEAA